MGAGPRKQSVFSLHGVDAQGRTVLRKTVRRDKLMELIAALPPCLASGTEPTTSLSAKIDDAKKLVGTQKFDKTAAGGPKVDVEFDAPRV